MSKYRSSDLGIRVGCSGWQYRHWRGDFYPADLPQSRWLEYYAARFDTVEVNNSFYKLPAEGLLGRWRGRVPARFLFAVKASRYLTHMKKLKDPEDPLDRIFTRARELGRKLGPVLYQLPPQLRKNMDRLQSFLEALPGSIRHAIEFRHPSWYDDEVFTALARFHVALCLHDMAGSATPREAVATFVYVRFHGTAGKYGGAYSKEQLEHWAAWLVDQKKPAFVYFNNDAGGHAPRDAAALLALVAGQHLDRSRVDRDAPEFL
jgi:uncharacterized protein YecE (DUF72 family)